MRKTNCKKCGTEIKVKYQRGRVPKYCVTCRQTEYPEIRDDGNLFYDNHTRVVANNGDYLFSVSFWLEISGELKRFETEGVGTSADDCFEQVQKFRAAALREKALYNLDTASPGGGNSNYS